jgi:hypothetical protein
MADQIFDIRSEDDAWSILETAIEKGTSEGIDFRFKGWPQIEVYLPDTPQDASISPSMMEAFIELQKTIYRSHTFLASDTGNLRTLSKIEREHFEFRVQVKPGSSDYNIDLTEIAKSLGADVVGHMTGPQITITVLGIALIVASVVAFKYWLNSKTEQRKSESDDADKRQWLETYQKQLEHDSHRIGLLMKAIEKQPVLGEIEASAEVARSSIVRAVGQENGGRAFGVELAPEFAAEISTTKRQQSTEIRLAGVYRVARVDTTVADGFRVTLADEKTGEEITASLIDALVSAEHKVAIQEAEWSKGLIFVELLAKRLRKRVVDAVVVNVQSHSDESASGAR